MHIINLYQGTPEWLEARKGKITGTKAEGLCLKEYANSYLDTKQALEAETDDKKRLRLEAKLEKEQPKYEARKVSAEFWTYLGEKLTKDMEIPDETALARGHRMEPYNILATLETMGIPEDECDTEPGLWVSDDDPEIACSPDAHEASMAPTWAIECKSLSTAKHCEYCAPVIMRNHAIQGDPHIEMLAKRLYMGETFEYATDFELIPDQYKAQCLQYFVVNPDLQTLYFSMYDDRINPAYSEWRHVILTLNREDIAGEILCQKDKEIETLSLVDVLCSLSATGAVTAGEETEN